MVGDYAIIRNPAIHPADEEIPEYIVDRVKFEFYEPKEAVFTAENFYVNEEVVKQMLGEK